MAGSDYNIFIGFTVTFLDETFKFCELVDQWPGQESKLHVHQVPTAVLYNWEGKVK